MKWFDAWIHRLGIRMPLRRGDDGRVPGPSEDLGSLAREVESLKARIAAVEAGVRADAGAGLVTCEADRDVSRLSARLDSVSERVARLSEEVMHVDSQIERIRIVESALERVESGTARQLAYIQELQAWEHRFSELRDVVDEFIASRDAIRDVLEKLNAVRPAGTGRGAAAGDDGTRYAAHGDGGALDAMPERVRRIAAELARKEAALERAIERLDRADLLATRAAITVRELEDQNGRLMAALQRAESQTGKVDTLVRDLELRIDELRSLAIRAARFEERLNSRAAEVRERLSSEIEDAEDALRALRAEHERLTWARGTVRDAPIHVVK